jgi:SulP family sulfate permease
MLRWLRHYPIRYLPGDIIAGLTVATMLVPQSMAYALLAGLPPEIGLYASILPVMVYGLMGSSRVLTFGPTAITSVLVLGILGTLAEPGSGEYYALALTLALFLGLVMVVMGLLRLGFIANLLSQPVLVGYINAAALIIVVSQLPNLFGVTAPRNSNTFLMFWGFLTRLNSLNVVTILVSVLCLLVLAGFRYRLPWLLAKLPIREVWKITVPRGGPLAVVVIGIVIVYLGGLDAEIAIVGKIPRGLPHLTVNDYEFSHLDTILVGALAIAFVGFIEAMSTAKSIQSPQEKTIAPNQELLAMGFANIASAVTGGMPGTTSISRSAVNNAAGANTGLSSIIAGLILVIVVLFLTPVFHYLPNAALASIIILSVVNLLDWKSVRELWKYNRLETVPLLVTFGVVFMVRIDIGILAGILATIAVFFWESARPKIVELGRGIEYDDRYWDRMRHRTVSVPGVLIVRVDESLSFANIGYFELLLRRLISTNPATDFLILDGSAVNHIDASALLGLGNLFSEFEEAGIRVMWAEMKSQVLDQLDSVGFLQSIGHERFYTTVHDAVIATERLVDDELPI